MSYLGNAPALAYTSFAKQDFTTSATTSYTLDNPVTNANELALFINFVRQEPTTAYSASGTALTLTSATTSSDDMYCVFLGKAVQTVNPPSGSVGASQLVDSSIALGKLSATGTKDATTFLRGDNTFASAGGDNTPAFAAFQSSGQNIDSGTTTIVTLDTEIFDTDSAFASNKFTVPSGEGGKYYVSAAIRADASWAATGQFNVMVFVGSTGDNGLFASYNIAASNGNGGAVSGILDLPAGEEITMRLYHNEGGTEGLQAGRYCTVFSGYKLIGI